MWAHHATPPPSPVDFNTLKNWYTNQKIRTIDALTLNIVTIPNQTNNLTFALGYKINYAPKIPEIAPLAPITGMVELTSEKTWIRVAHIPQNK